MTTRKTQCPLCTLWLYMVCNIGREVGSAHQ